MHDIMYKSHGKCSVTNCQNNTVMVNVRIGGGNIAYVSFCPSCLSKMIANMRKYIKEDIVELKKREQEINTDKEEQ